MPTRSSSVALAGTLILAGIGATSAVALPGIPSKSPTASLVVPTAGCHRSCEYGPVLGWHRHGAGCRPIACRPAAVYPNRCFVNRYGVRYCRW